MKVKVTEVLCWRWQDLKLRP